MVAYNINMFGDVTLLVSTCNEYQELLPGFLKSLKKYFPSFDGPIKTNISNCKYLDGIKKIKNEDFSSRIIQALKEIKTKYVLFFLEDFYLTSCVDKNFVYNALQTLQTNKRYGSAILHDGSETLKMGHIEVNECFVECNQFAPYKNTTQVTLWKKEYLLKILRKGESAWQFEYYGSYRSHRYKKWKVLYPKSNFQFNAFHYDVAGIMYGGKMIDNAIEYFKSFGLSVPTIKRKKVIVKNKLLKRIYDHTSFVELYLRLSVYFKHVKCRTNVVLDIAKKENDI